MSNNDVDDNEDSDIGLCELEEETVTSLSFGEC